MKEPGLNLAKTDDPSTIALECAGRTLLNAAQVEALADDLLKLRDRMEPAVPERPPLSIPGVKEKEVTESPLVWTEYDRLHRVSLFQIRSRGKWPTFALRMEATESLCGLWDRHREQDSRESHPDQAH